MEISGRHSGQETYRVRLLGLGIEMVRLSQGDDRGAFIVSSLAVSKGPRNSEVPQAVTSETQPWDSMEECRHHTFWDTPEGAIPTIHSVSCYYHAILYSPLLT